MKEVNIFKLIKDSFVKGFIRGFEKTYKDTHPYKLFLGEVELGYFQSLKFKNQHIELERGLLNINWMEGVKKPHSMIFNIRGPINAWSFKIDGLILGQIVGRKAIAVRITGLADLILNYQLEDGKD